MAECEKALIRSLQTKCLTVKVVDLVRYYLIVGIGLIVAPVFWLAKTREFESIFLVLFVIKEIVILIMVSIKIIGEMI